MRKSAKFTLLSAAVAMGLSMVSCQKDDDGKSGYDFAKGTVAYKIVVLPNSVGDNPITRKIEIETYDSDSKNSEMYEINKDGTIIHYSTDAMDITGSIEDSIEDIGNGEPMALEELEEPEKELVPSAKMSYTWNEEKSEIYAKVDSIIIDGKEYGCDAAIKYVNNTMDSAMAEAEKAFAELKKVLESMPSDGFPSYYNSRIADSDGNEIEPPFDFDFGDDFDDDFGGDFGPDFYNPGYVNMMKLLEADSISDFVASMAGFDSYRDMKNSTINMVIASFNTFYAFDVEIDDNNKYTFKLKPADVLEYSGSFCDDNMNSISGGYCNFFVGKDFYDGFITGPSFELRLMEFSSTTGNVISKVQATYVQSEDFKTVTVTVDGKEFVLTFDPFVLSEIPVLD